MPIRWRLTLWYGGVLTLVLVVFSGVVYAVMRHQFLERIDAGLHEELSDVLSEIERAADRTGLLSWLDRRFAHHEGFDFQITTSSGQRIFANIRLGERRLPIPDLKDVSDQSVYRTAILNDEGRWRIVASQVPGPDGPLLVQVARSLDVFEHEMSELLAVLAGTVPACVALALAGGYFLARRALDPVSRMTESARCITGQRFSERIDVPKFQDELGQLATTLNQTFDRLETSFREMQRFTADASHELRTPLAAIQMEAEVAMERSQSESERELLGNILEECQGLNTITEQLLSLSREDAGLTQFPRQPVDIGQLIRDVAATIEPLAKSKEQKLTVSADTAAVIQGDPVRLRRVVFNLLDNAIKYTPPGGEIRTAVTATNGKVRLIVEDTGIGIPDEHLPHVFERFYRVDKARSRAEGGAGFGLSIVQSIISSHGGTVTITSTLDKGTQCVVEFAKD